MIATGPACWRRAPVWVPCVRILRAVLVVLPLGAAACGLGAGGRSSDAPDPARGRRVYLANCSSCHSPDPSRPGPLGPAIQGSSRELIEARVLRAGYPSSYRPKRTSRLMPAQPHLAARIDDLAAFLK